MDKKKKSDVEKYLSFGKYSQGCPAYLIKKAKAIPHRGVSERYILNLIRLISAEFNSSKYKVTLTHSFKQSRFISVRDVLRKRHCERCVA